MGQIVAHLLENVQNEMNSLSFSSLSSVNSEPIEQNLNSTVNIVKFYVYWEIMRNYE